MSTIAIEKATNYCLRPVVKVKRYPKTFPLRLPQIDKNDSNFVCRGYWDINNFIMLNIISQEFLRHHYNLDVPTNHFDSRVTSQLKFGINEQTLKEDEAKLLLGNDPYIESHKYHGKDENQINELAISQSEEILDKLPDWKFVLREKDIVINYPTFRKHNSSQIYKVLEETSGFRFVCAFNYKLLQQQSSYDKNDKLITNYKYRLLKIIPGGFVATHYKGFNLFDLKEIPKRATSHDPPRILERDYEISFNNPLAKLFAHNLLFLNLIYVPFEVLELSRDAQLIYRRFILPVKSVTNTKITHFKKSFEQIVGYLNISTNDTSRCKKRLNGALEELKSKGFISDFSNTKGRFNDWKMYTFTL